MMLTINRNRAISIGVGIVIVLYGTFGKQLWPFYQSITESLVSGPTLEGLMSFLKGRKAGQDDIYNLGKYFIYYPSYLTLHALLITSLYWGKARRVFFANAIFSMILMVLSAIILFSYVQQFHRVYDAAMGLMHSLLNMPLILFIVEGGRILLSDVDKGLSHMNADLADSKSPEL